MRFDFWKKPQLSEGWQKLLAQLKTLPLETWDKCSYHEDHETGQKIPIPDLRNTVWRDIPHDIRPLATCASNALEDWRIRVGLVYG